MCDPVSALVAVSAGTSLYGSIKSGNAAKKAGSKQQQSYNRLADERLKKVEFDVATAESGYRRDVGKNLAAIGQTGIARTSFYDVLADSAQELQLQKDAIKYSGQQEATQLREQGAVAYQSGKDQQTASYINGVANIVGAAANIKVGSVFDSGWQTTTRNAQGQII